MPKLNEPIPLSFQFHDGSSTKYVRAVVKNDAQSAISGSPFALTHVSGGKYVNDTGALMPSTTYVTADYAVYDDSGFTTVSTDYDGASETFEFLDSPTTTIVNASVVEAVVDNTQNVTALVGEE